MKNTSNLNTSINHNQNNLQQNIFPRKPLEELNMMDAFLFEAVTEEVENAQIGYNDGILKIFLNTKGTKGGSKELKALLNYMENSNEANAVDEDLVEIQEIVGNVKSNQELRGVIWECLE